jgi:tetratricopeptide (TPR) repeat protein
VKKTTIIIFLIGLSHFSVFSQNIDSLEQLLNRPEDTVKVNLLNRLSEIHTAAGRYEKSESLAIEAQAMAKKINYLLGLHWSYRHLYLNANAKAQFTQCLSLINKSIETAEDLERMDLIVESKLILATVLGNMDFDAQAIKVSLEACSLATKLNNKEITATAFRHLSSAYHEIGNYRLSIDYDLLAVNLLNDLNDAGTVAIVYSNIGLAYSRMRKFDSAIYYHKKAIETYEKAGEVRNMAYLLAMCGKTYTQSNNFEGALVYFNKAILWHKNKRPAITTYAFCLLNISEIILKQSKKQEISLQVNYTKLTQDLEEAIKLFKSYDNFPYLLRGYTAMQEISERTGNYKMANEYSKEIMTVKDSVNNREQKQKRDELMVQHQVKENEQKISQLKQKTSTYNIIVSLLVGLVSVSILSGFLFVSRQKLRYKNEKIEAERQKLELKKKIYGSEIKALRSQMNPHFIFNCLNTIHDKVLSGHSTEATKYIGDFGMLLRKVLSNSDYSFISLKDEIATLELYLNIESVRFDDKFKWEIKVDSKIDADSIELPPMLIQPILENAIHHGLLSMKSGGILTIHFLRQENKLICLVEDNGVGIENKKKQTSVSNNQRKSKGGVLINDRLAILNQAHNLNATLQTWDLSNLFPGKTGTRVELSFDINRLEED